MSKDYFARRALSNSGIKRILQSPAHFKYYTDNKGADTTAMRQGRAFHLLILQPKLAHLIATFDATKTLTSKAGTAFLEANPDKIVLTADELHEVLLWTSALLDNKKMMCLIDSCSVEYEVYNQIESSFGLIDCKAMLDAHNDQVIIDLKTTDKSAQDFVWEARKYSLDVQAAWYRAMMLKNDGRQRDFYFVVVEKNPPFGVLIYKASDEFIAKGWEKCERAIDLYGHAIAANLWLSYDSDTILTL
jgi:hypothetical protein